MRQPMRTQSIFEELGLAAGSGGASSAASRELSREVSEAAAALPAVIERAKQNSGGRRRLPACPRCLPASPPACMGAAPEQGPPRGACRACPPVADASPRPLSPSLPPSLPPAVTEVIHPSVLELGSSTGEICISPAPPHTYSLGRPSLDLASHPLRLRNRAQTQSSDEAGASQPGSPLRRQGEPSGSSAAGTRLHSYEWGSVDGGALAAQEAAAPPLRRRRSSVAGYVTGLLSSMTLKRRAREHKRWVALRCLLVLPGALAGRRGLSQRAPPRAAADRPAALPAACCRHSGTGSDDAPATSSLARASRLSVESAEQRPAAAAAPGKGPAGPLDG
jgi:hypothetical protein